MPVFPFLGQTTGLQENFGKDRVRDTPICENIMTGMAVGAAAAAGYRPICHLLYGNFIYTGFDSIANQAAKLKYMTAGQVKLPIVYMAVIGGGEVCGCTTLRYTLSRFDELRWCKGCCAVKLKNS